MILIDAVYINRSGGKILLEYLIKTIFDLNIVKNFFFLFDDRLESELLEKIPLQQFELIKGSEYNRFIFYKNRKLIFSSVLCFGNVPPPFNVSIKNVFIYFHNALILENFGTNYGILTRFIFFSKKSYIRLKSKRRYVWLVQTNHMAELLESKLRVHNDSIKIIPIYDVEKFIGLNKSLEENNQNFLYVADGTKQKNHLLLLDAWKSLNKDHKLGVTLNLTIPPDFFELCQEIEQLRNNGILVNNHGFCDYNKIKHLYANNNYFIMPSLTESFGLPLLEAATAGCEIIAANLEYVHDVLIPLSVFDPKKEEELTNCILNLKKPKEHTTKIKAMNEIDKLLKLLNENV